MKEVPLSVCEKTSLLANLEVKLRLDGRKFDEIRPIKILFGKDYGSCMVVLGETRVFSQVTCEIVEPRPSRPNEGKISLSIHLSPMAAPHFEPGKGGDIIDDLQQILDRNIKESKCVDLESLCILAEESVWNFKVDITVLNHCGNLADACNLSAVCALRHFHRPDVTVEEGGNVIVHTKEERDLIPTFLKKIPVCLTYALFPSENGCYTIIDPTEKEERVMSGRLIIGLNPHGEITSLIFPGKVCVEKHFIMNCISRSYLKTKSIAEMVLEHVENDLEKKKTGQDIPGFLDAIKSDSKYCKNNILNRVNSFQSSRRDQIESKISVDDSSNVVEKKDEITPMVYDDNITSSSDEEFSQEALSMTLPEIKKKNMMTKKKRKKGKANAKKEHNIKDEEMDISSCKLNMNDL